MTDMIHAALGSGGNMKSYGGGAGGQHPSSIKPPPSRPRNIVVAGHDDGYPAPNFLQPLASRESHFVTSWDYNNNSSINVALSMPSYINGISTTVSPTAGVGVEESFRHRPRLGRGGRIIIDRIPMVHHYGNSSSSSSNNASHHKPPPTVITYGSSQMRRRFGTTNANDRVVNGEYTTNPQHYDLLLQPSLGDTTALTRKIEEICALGLMEDYHTARSNNTSNSSNNNKGGGTSSSGTTATAISNSGSLSTGIPMMTTAASSSSLAMEEMDEVLIPIQDWFEAPESMKIYGSEKFVIGPL
jgi:enhancer of polycomb-like protein